MNLNFMNIKENANNVPKCLLQIVIYAIATSIISIAVLCIFRPHIFTFHANVSSELSISGKVFRSKDGIFFIKLDSGSQFVMQQKPLKLFLRPSSNNTGFCIGHLLILPASAIGGIDLGQSESFNRQVPIIQDGVVMLKDPLTQNGAFFFR